MCLIASVLIVGSPGSVSAADAAWKTFYAAPDGNGAICSRAAPGSLQSVQKAVQSAIPQMAGDIHVVLQDGRYELKETLRLTNGDSGVNGYKVVWRAEHPGKAIVHGGRELRGGWQLHNAEKGIWRRPGVDGDFRQLYVNGCRAIRARSPNLNPEHPAGGPCYVTDDTKYPFRVPSNTIGPWAYAGDVEFVWKGQWRQLRGRIKSFQTNHNDATVTFQDPEAHCRRLNHANHKPLFYYFENHYDLLDAPGEWYLDRKNNDLFYRPRAQENMDDAVVIAPCLEVLLSITGSSPEQRTGPLCFTGLTFRYSNWTAPSREGYMTQQGARGNDASGDPKKIGDGESPRAMVELRNADHIHFERNLFEFSGAHALSALMHTDHLTIRGNVFRDLSASAIWVHQAYERGVGARHVDVDNNLVTDFGRHYRDAVGIGAGFVSHTRIRHNEVRYGGYSGISIGWNWREHDNGLSHNEVAHNRVHNVCLLNEDGGGIYSLGHMAETRFHHNYVYGIRAGVLSPGLGSSGIYLDNGSQQKLIDMNVVEVDNGPTLLNWSFKVWEGWKDHRIFDNIVRHNFVNNPTNVIHTKGSKKNTVENMIVCQGKPWPPEALVIMDAAGITAAYADIADDTTHGRSAAVGAASSASSSMGNDTTAAAGNDNDLLKGLWASKGIKDDPSPWWQVDLGQPHRIYQVELLSRVDKSDQAPVRKNFVVWGSQTPDFSKRVILAQQGNHAFPHKQAKSFLVIDPGRYRYVRVGRPGRQGHFNFAEVRVIGVPADRD